MPDELQKVLFEVDQPTSREGTEGEKGTGFGMSIVKSYVEMFGGTLDVYSRDKERFPDQHGTTMTLRLKRV